MDVKNEPAESRRSPSRDAEAVVAGSATLGGGRLRLVLLLGSLVALGPLTTDMYLPALPAITSELHTSPAAIQLTLTGALAGLALGQLLVGPLSDAIGRRTPLLAGVSVHIVASALCLLAPNLVVLDVLRVSQGLGAATSTVITMAIVRDLFEGAAAAGLLSRLMLVLGVSPILAPTLGGIVLARSSWRGVFAVLAVLSLVIILAAAYALPETLPDERRRTGGLSSTLRDFTRLLGDRVFVGLILLAGLAMSTIFAFVSGSPFVFQGHFGMSEQEFGYAFGVGALGLVLASQLNVRLLRRRSPSQVLTRSFVAATVAGGLLLTCAATGFGGMAGSFVPLWLVLFTVGFTLPNASALALSRHGEVAGTAAALLGAVQFGIGAVAAPLVGVIGTGPAAMASVIALTLAVAVVILVAVVRPWRLTAPVHQ
jgi:DHA1 family bicyclomycin/chloramphenicol resistance-like MFS transporter